MKRNKKKPRQVRNINGFSLVEFAIVVVVAGFLLVTGLGLYSAYMNERRVMETYDKQRQIESSIAMFRNAYGRLPCPADPSLPVSDPAFGVENCFLMDDTVAIGTCTDGSQSLCKVAGARDTPADTDSSPDPVLIGTVPITSLRDVSVETSYDEINFNSILDPWDYQMSYAVSGYLTQDNLYRSGYGSLRIETETGTPLTFPEDSGHYVLLGHGRNHAGAYTLNGTQTVPCTTGLDESENCNGDATFVSGILSRGDNNQYYDDTLKFSAHSVSGIWEFFSSGDGDIYNLNPGNVGIGVANPSEKVEVKENVRTDRLTQTELCSTLSGDGTCWSPDNLASITGISCPGTPPPGEVFVVQRIRHGTIESSDCVSVPQPAPLPDQSCPEDEYVVGFHTNGSIICEGI